MIFKKTIVLMVGAIAGLLVNATRVEAQYAPPAAPELQAVGINATELNSLVKSQEKSEWCWAAAIQLALSVYHIDIAQADIVARTYGTGWDQDPVNRPGSNDAITRNLTGWGVDHNGNRYVVGCYAGAGVPNASGVIAALQQKHPIILALNIHGSGHAVVCTAAYYYNTEQGPVIQKLIIRDPWPYADWEQVKGRYELPGSDVPHMVMGYWVVTASKEDAQAAGQKARRIADELQPQATLHSYSSGDRAFGPADVDDLAEQTASASATSSSKSSFEGSASEHGHSCNPPTSRRFDCSLQLA